MPTKIQIQNIFYSWLTFYCKNKKLSRVQRLIDNNDVLVYIEAIQKNIVKNNFINIQDAILSSNGVDLPYLYVDENYKFITFLPDYSNKTLIKHFMNDYSCAEFEVKKLMYTLYFRLLPCKTGASGKYVLVVIEKAIEAGQYIGDIWLFSVLPAKDGNESNYTFFEIKYENGQAQHNAIIDYYSYLDFYKSEISEVKQYNGIDGVLYDIDKVSGDLFLYDRSGVDYNALRFEWDGNRYVKKWLVKRSFVEETVKKVKNE